MVLTPNYNSFNKGELSPKLYGRDDTEAYQRGLRRCRNFVVENEGPVTFRMGTTFVAETHNNEVPFLYRFQHTTEQAYILEFTNNTMRVFRNLGVVENMGSPITVATPFATADLCALKFAQNATEMYVSHPTYNPQKITRTSDIAWTVANHSPTALTLGADDYPAAVGIYEQRLIYGGSNNEPETLFFSKSGDVDDFTIGTNQDDGLKAVVSATEDSNNIEWIRGTENFLLVGGFGDLVRITGGQGDEAIGPNPDNAPSPKPTNTYAVADINPVTRQQYVFYVHRNGRSIITFEVDQTTGIYRPINRNEFAEHLSVSGIKQIAYQDGRPSVLWCVLHDGVLLGLTISRDQEVSGWHKHTTDGKFLSIATTPSGADGYDTLWCAVERTIDGQTKRYIEYFNIYNNFPMIEDYQDTDDEEADNLRFSRALAEAQKKYVHLDSSLTYDGTARGITADAALTPGAVTGAGITFTTDNSVFIAGDVGNDLTVKSVDGTRYGRGKVTAYTSGTEVTVTVLEDFDSTTAFPAGEWYITASSLSGLGHLEGKTVGIVADGGIHDDVVVTSGAVSLDIEASVVHVGLKYRGVLEMLDIALGSRVGSAITKPKNLTAIGFKFLNTLGVSYGASPYQLDRRLVRRPQDFMDTPPPLFTGTQRVTYRNARNPLTSGWALEVRPIVVQDQPLPAQVQNIIPYYEMSDTL